MLRSSMMALVLAALVVTGAVAQTQPGAQGTLPVRFGVLGRGVDSRPVPKLGLIMTASVQEELKLTDVQKKKIADVIRQLQDRNKEIIEERRQALESLDQPPDPGAVEAIRATWRAKGEAVDEEVERGISRTLESRQLSRIDQIQLQAEGPMAFLRPNVQARLNLGPGQIDEIEAIVTVGREEISKASAVPLPVKPGGGLLAPERAQELAKSKEFESNIEKHRDLAIQARKATMQKISRILTKRQRAAYDAQLGEPFDMEKLRAGVMQFGPDRKDEAKAQPAPSAKEKPAAKTKRGEQP
jgi:Spy/CpxP family protein refolding chaperone